MYPSIESAGSLYYVIDGEAFIRCTDSGFVPLDFSGQQGVAGVDGVKGDSGVIGLTGTAGAQGDTGVAGANGTNGADGIQGTQGEAGSDGANGSQGIQGDAGTDGTSITWLGTLGEKPSSPNINEVFYWKPAGISCIWDGTTWNIMSVDNGVNATACLSVPDSLITGSLYDTRDNNFYSWVLIGNQRWMSQNLAYLPQVDSTGLGAESDANAKYYYVVGYDPTGADEAAEILAAKATSTYITYGVQYNWFAAIDGTVGSDSIGVGIQGACPTGWHVPNSAEWDALADYIAVRESLPDTAQGSWLNIAPQLKNDSGWDAFGGILKENTYGFSAIGNYYRSSTYSYAAISGGHFWSANEESSANGWRRSLGYNNDIFFRFSYQKDDAYAVRCLQDVM